MQLGFVKVALFAWNGPTGQGRLLFMNSGWFYYLYGWVIFFWITLRVFIGWGGCSGGRWRRLVGCLMWVW